MDEGDELLDINQAAQFLQVSVTSLRRWTDSGRLSCLRVGRRRERRFRRADLVAFMEHEPARTPAAPVAALAPHEGQAVVGGIPVPYGSHFAALYGSDLARANQAVAYLADGLRPGTTCLLVAEPEARDPIVAQLERGGPPLRARIDAGQLVLGRYSGSPAAQLEQWEAAFVSAIRAGAHSLRVVGDVWGLARALTPQALVDYEAAYDRLLARRYPVITMCQYDVRRFGSMQILEALKGHGDTFRYPVERLLG